MFRRLVAPAAWPAAWPIGFGLAALLVGAAPGAAGADETAVAEPVVTVISGEGTRAYAPDEYAAAAGTQTAAAEPGANEAPGGGILSEIRVGALAHDVGVFGTEKEDGIDGNVELLFASPGFLEPIFAPRPHLGATVNSEGRTSQIYAGLTWEWRFWDPFFVDGSLGLAVHDGKIDNATGDRKAFGCRAAFRESVSLGVRIFERHSLSVMLDHMSNANLCDENPGLETLGVRYGFRF